jgi:carbonic anhydrase/acetyltransferase-like protein (isoleucine patch superfamily)
VPLYALGDLEPEIDPTAFVHPDAVLIGAVRVGAESSVWPCAVLRGDNSPITIGARTSVQDGCVLHTTEELATVVGDDCVIGHLVHLEGCTIHERVLVGVGAVVLHRVHVHPGAVVAANAVVLDDTLVPPGALALGVPAKIREGAADPGLAADGARNYVARTARYRRELRRIG